MRVNLAVLIFCEVKLRLPSDKAAARVLLADELWCELCIDLDCGEDAVVLLLPVVLFAGCRCSCRAFASAFS